MKHIEKELTHNPELFYVLGAVLGDGYTYGWKDKKREHFRVGLDVKNKIFALKYAQKISKGMGSKINACYYANKELWFVRLDNKELYLLVTKLRFSPDLIVSLINKNDKSLSKAINFIEGFFDADGCVKIINDSARKIPKIRLDFMSTDSNRIEVIRILLERYLGIKAKYSNQDAYISKDGFPRKKAYHLRIYKKEFVKRFLKKIKTIKLYNKKIPYVEKWMNNTWTGGPHPIPK